MVSLKKIEFDYGRAVRIVGFLLMGKGIYYWLRLILTMYAYATLGDIGGKAEIFFFANLLMTATIILGIYLAELGAIAINKPGAKRILTLKKEIPKRKVGILLAIEIIALGFVLFCIPELPKLWVVLGVEGIVALWSFIA